MLLGFPALRLWQVACMRAGRRVLPGLACLGAVLSPISVQADNRFFGGSDVTIAAPLSGDAVILGRDIRISAAVEGSIDAIGLAVRLTGPVSGDVRLGGQDLRVNSPLAGALDAYGMRIALGAAARIEGQVTLSGDDIVISGRIDDNLVVDGQQVLLNGRIDGDATIKAKRLEVGPDARLNGRIDYQGAAPPVIDPEADISGDIAWSGDSKSRWRAYLPDWMAKLLALRQGDLSYTYYADTDRIGRGGLIALILIGAVITLLFPSASAEISYLRNGRLLQAFAVGLLLIVFFPIAAVLIMGTIFGIAVSLFLMMVYLALLLAGIVGVAMLLGGWLLERVGERRGNAMWRLGEVTTGVVALWLIAQVPLVAMPSLFLLMVLGTGLATLAINRRVNETRRPAPATGSPSPRADIVSDDKGDGPPVAR